MKTAKCHQPNNRQWNLLIKNNELATEAGHVVALGVRNCRLKERKFLCAQEPKEKEEKGSSI
jgi:hypothetical protein